MKSLYLHIPFCLRKCRYCDFNSYAGLAGTYDRYTEALAAELGFWARTLHQAPHSAIETVYLGGGTPTLLGCERIGRILAACQSIGLAEDVEITVEANPGTIDWPLLEELRSQGVNRLSIGVQSLDDGMLAALGRVHDAEEARSAVRLARRAGFGVLNLDLIYGLPGQDLAHWEATLQGALALEPEHLSLYALTLEEGTPLATDVAAGRLLMPDQDLCADMYGQAELLLAQAGYEHYEISNWARPGYRCRHNLTYWHNDAYLGCGAGAHSWLWGNRFYNLLHPQAYQVAVMEAVSDGKSCWRISPPRDKEDNGLGKTAWGTAQTFEILDLPWVAEARALNQADQLAETMILGLRLSEGVDLAKLSARFGRDLAALYGKRCQELTAAGLMWRDGPRLGLTPKGRLLGNEAFMRFLPDACD